MALGVKSKQMKLACEQKHRKISKIQLTTVKTHAHKEARNKVIREKQTVQGRDGEPLTCVFSDPLVVSKIITKYEQTFQS